MNNTLVSIIIPTYNTERAMLDRCIQSILQQTYKSLECLIVDDGSRTDYASSLDVYESLDPRIRVLHKVNGGLGSARNVGVSNSTGEYVFFLDSDDYISPYTLEVGVKLAVESDADMVVGGLIHVDATEEPGFRQQESRTVSVESRSEKTALIMHLSGIKQQGYCLETGQTGPSACSRLVRKGLAAEVPFENDKYWDEDNLWNISLVDKCQNILIADICWYAYVINPNSMVRGYAGDRTKEFQTRAKQEYQRIKDLWPECIQGAYYHIWDGLLRYCRTDTFHKMNPKDSIEKYKAFCNATDFEEFKEAIENINFNYERRLKYRIAKKMIKKMLLMKNKKYAFQALGICIKRIKY